jgi:replication factor A1
MDMKAMGRPRGDRHSRIDRRSLESLAKIALTMDIESSELFEGLNLARRQKEYTLGNLTIKYLKKNQEDLMFLFLDKDRVLAQFPIPSSLMTEKNPLEDYVDRLKSEESPIKKMEKNPKIVDLKPGMQNVTINGKVVEILGAKSVYTRFGSQVYVSDAIISDETDTIKLTLWNQQVNKISVDDMIQLQNAKVVNFRGHRQLRLGRAGTLTVITEEKSIQSNIA